MTGNKKIARQTNARTNLAEDEPLVIKLSPKISQMSILELSDYPEAETLETTFRSRFRLRF